MNELITQETEVPGQITLPGMALVMGYESTKLDSRKEKFCWEYVCNGGYGGRAYLKAYPDCISTNSSDANASRLLKNPKIQARISEVQEETRRRFRATVDDVLEYHGKVLKVDREEYFNEKGEPKQVSEIDPVAKSILEYDSERCPKSGTVIVKFKVPTRHQSAVELAKIFGMNEDKVPVRNEINIQTESYDRLTKMEALFDKYAPLPPLEEIDQRGFDLLRKRTAELAEQGVIGIGITE